MSELSVDLINIDDETESLLTRSEESNTGHIEYKYKLTNLKDIQIEKLTTQMK